MYSWNSLPQLFRDVTPTLGKFQRILKRRSSVRPAGVILLRTRDCLGC